jgi:hypothetical protein
MGYSSIIEEGSPLCPCSDPAFANPRPLVGVFFYKRFYNVGNGIGNSEYISFFITTERNLQGGINDDLMSSASLPNDEYGE